MRARVARVRLQRAPNQIPTCTDIWGLLSDHVCVGSDRFWHAVEADPGDARPHAREDDTVEGFKRLTPQVLSTRARFLHVAILMTRLTR